MFQINPNTASSTAMTRIVPSTPDHSSPVRTSNGLVNEGRGSIADMLNNASGAMNTMSTPLRASSGLSLETNIRKRKMSDTCEDVCSRRRRIAEHKAVRLKRIQKEYVEHVSEMLTLEGCGLEDIYRKQPSIPALLNYFKNNPLDPEDDTEDLIVHLAPPPPQLPEVKVAVAAVPGTTTTPVPSTVSPLAAVTTPPKTVQQCK